MKYEDWRKTAVHCSDIRCLGIDGFMDIDSPVPGVAFMVPKIGDFRGHPIIERWDCTGYITRDDNRGMWDVQICNIEREFVDLEKAIRYLWDEWVKSECFSDPERTSFLLYGVDEFGKTIVNQVCQNEDHMIELAKNEMPDVEYHEELEKCLRTIGARYFEFSHGHLVAFPLEK